MLQFLENQFKNDDDTPTKPICDIYGPSLTDKKIDSKDDSGWTLEVPKREISRNLGAGVSE